MPDNKLTDNEIVKGLEICSNNGDCKECPINPHHGNYGYCTSLAIKAALDLINRLQDKNKAYKYYYDECLKDLKKANTENERLKYCNETNISSIATLHERLKTAKAEAYKECFALIKNNLFIKHKTLDNECLFEFSGNDLDNLLKELVGEEK